MLAAGGIEYEDVRVTFEEWPKIKDSEETKKKPQTISHKKHKFLSFSFHKETPLGKLPILELDDGTIIAESNAIGRLVAK